MADLTGSILKLNRAAFHLGHLKQIVEGFSESKPYTFFVEPSPSPPDFVLRVRINHNLPNGCGLVAGDFVHNVRSALDHLIYEISTLPADHKGRRHLYFPLCQTESEYRKNEERQLLGVGESERAIVEQFQPFNVSGGHHDDALVLLGKISNFDKHRAIAIVCAISNLDKLVPTKGAFSGIEFSGDAGITVIRGGAKHSYVGVGDGRITEDGQVIARISTPSDICMEPIVHTVIKFGAGDPAVEGCDVFPILAPIFDRAREVVERFRTHFGLPTGLDRPENPGSTSDPVPKIEP